MYLMSDHGRVAPDERIGFDWQVCAQKPALEKIAL